MSLKAFHLVFIIASIVLAIGFGVWALSQYFSPSGGKLYLAAGIGSFVAALGLVGYEVYFLKKLKKCQLSMSRFAKLKFFCAVLASGVVAHAPSALACAACFGNQTDSPLAKGMNAGIFSLLGVVVCVLGGIASVAIYLAKKAAAAAAAAAPNVELAASNSKA